MAQLAGDNSVGVASNVSQGFSILGQFVATASGTGTAMKVQLSATGGVQVAVYSDLAGAPNALLASAYTFSGVSGLNTIPFSSSVNIVAGQTYWLGVDTQNFNQLNITTTGGTTEFKALTYTSLFPDPAGTGYSNAAWILSMYIDGTITASTTVRRRRGIGN